MHFIQLRLELFCENVVFIKYVFMYMHLFAMHMNNGHLFY